VKVIVYYGFTEEELHDMKEMVSRHGDHELVHASTDEEALADITDAEVLMGHFPASVTSAGKRLRWIQSFSAGMDKLLDPGIVGRDEVVITNMAGLYAPQGGEHAWALLLALARGILPAVQSQMRREWKGGAAVELTGGVLGIVGLGGFGLETLKRAAGYDMKVLALDPVRTEPPVGVAEVAPPTKENLHSMLARSDAVVVACPRTKET
jgi:phosphoglycerate dehydrogenase-like enzyme